MATEDLTATGYPSIYAPTISQAGVINMIKSSVEVTATIANGSTYTLVKNIPSSAIIVPEISYLFWDDLDGSVNSPTVDLGIFGHDGSSITDDDNALLDGLDVTTAGSSKIPATLTATIVTQALWDYVNGVSADPEELFDIKATLQDDAVDTGGTIALQLAYWTLP